MLAVRFITVFWITSTKGLDALVLKQPISFVTQHFIPPLSKTLL